MLRTARARKLAAYALLLAFGCATRHLELSSAYGPAIEPFYDPAAEWPPVARAARSMPRRPLGPSPDAGEPGMELRAFTAHELTRIARVRREVEQAARAERLPADLINGIIWVESRFVVRARGQRGPLGLMQLMPGTGREVAQTLGLRYAPYDAAFNIRAGTYYFGRLLERFHGNLRLSLAAYNIGPAVVRGWVRDQQPLPERSERYITNVFMAARAFRQRGL